MQEEGIQQVAMKIREAFDSGAPPIDWVAALVLLLMLV